MRFFPFRRDRAQSDAMMDHLDTMLTRDGFTFFALEDKTSGQLLGMTGLAHLEPILPMAPAVEIGWRLFPEAWGQGYASEAARACLDYAFHGLGLDAVVSFCVEDNAASERVMQRIGMRYAGTFDHPKIDRATHPHFVRHRNYRIEPDETRRPSSIA